MNTPLRPDWDGVPHRLRQGLDARRYSQRRYADDVGVSVTAVVNWLNGAKISGDHLPAAADALGLSVEELLGYVPVHASSSAGPGAAAIARELADLAERLEPLSRAVPDLMKVLGDAKRYVEGD